MTADPEIREELARLRADEQRFLHPPFRPVGDWRTERDRCLAVTRRHLARLEQLAQVEA